MEHKGYRPTIKFIVVTSPEFNGWLEIADIKTKTNIDARFTSIENENYFGWIKKYDGLTVLKWKNGLRVYGKEYKTNQRYFVVCGGNKNGQNKDIKEAQRLLKKYEEI